MIGAGSNQAYGLKVSQPESLFYLKLSKENPIERCFLDRFFSHGFGSFPYPERGAASLGGQLFNFTGAPNRYGLGPFYELHVWAWRPNPHGTFADMNPTVSCEHAAMK